MYNPKKQVIKFLETLPDGIKVDKVFVELYFMLQIDQGLEELGHAKDSSPRIVNEQVESWLEKIL